VEIFPLDLDHSEGSHDFDNFIRDPFSPESDVEDGPTTQSNRDVFGGESDCEELEEEEERFTPMPSSSLRLRMGSVLRQPQPEPSPSPPQLEAPPQIWAWTEGSTAFLFPSQSSIDMLLSRYDIKSSPLPDSNLSSSLPLFTSSSFGLETDTVYLYGKLIKSSDLQMLLEKVEPVGWGWGFSRRWVSIDIGKGEDDWIPVFWAGYETVRAQMKKLEEVVFGEGLEVSFGSAQ